VAGAVFCAGLGLAGADVLDGADVGAELGVIGGEAVGSVMIAILDLAGERSGVFGYVRTQFGSAPLEGFRPSDFVPAATFGRAVDVTDL
jgi:hypothetical protein